MVSLTASSRSFSAETCQCNSCPGLPQRPTRARACWKWPQNPPPGPSPGQWPRRADASSSQVRRQWCIQQPALSTEKQFREQRHQGLRRQHKRSLGVVAMSLAEHSAETSAGTDTGSQRETKAGLENAQAQDGKNGNGTVNASAEAPFSSASTPFVLPSSPASAAVTAVAAAVSEGEEDVVDLSGVTEWELDFCSRPLLDERGKRVWELLVCNASRQLQFAEFFPSNRINSATLKDAILRVCASTGAPKPQKIRFFRAQMQTIISKACAELDIQAVPSQRCVTLVRWLEERLEGVYKRDPSFQAGAPLLQLEPPPPQDLPDTLRGEQWAFVQLPLSGILGEAKRVQAGEMFGSVLSLDAIGLGDTPLTAMIPGVSVQSSRATPLAAWTSSLELAHLRVDTARACLLLSTGVSDIWRYAFYRKSSAADSEARAWEEAKRQCGGLHFLAVQRDLEEEDCTGFWLLHDTNPPSF